MASRYPTASSLPRVAMCPPSAVLPHQPLARVAAGTIGDAVHLYLSAGVVPAAPEALAVCEQVQKAIPPGVWRHEVTFALDLDADTARELGENLGRDYSAALPHELIGTCDAVDVVESTRTVRLLELKTGYRHVGTDSLQIKLLALAAARTYDCSTVEILLLTAHPDGARLEPLVLDALALDEIALELTDLRAVIDTAHTATPHPGDWCRYCPAMAACPAALGLVRALAAVPDAEPLRLEQLAATYRTAKAARAALVRLESQLEAWALTAPIPLGAGRYWGPRDSEKWEFAETAPASLRALLGSSAEKAIGQTISSSSLARALGKEQAAAVTEKLAALGLASKRQTSRLAEYTERPEPKP